MSVSKQNPDPEPPDFIGLDGHSIPIIFGVKCRPLRVWILLNTSRFMAEASIKSIESAVRGETVPYIGLDSGCVAALVDSESFDERLYLHRVRPRGTLFASGGRQALTEESGMPVTRAVVARYTHQARSRRWRAAGCERP